MKFNTSQFKTSALKASTLSVSAANRSAFAQRGSLKGQIIATTDSGYNVRIAGGFIIRSVKASATWLVNDWVTVATTDGEYTIIGYAASGQEETVPPPPSP